MVERSGHRRIRLTPRDHSENLTFEDELLAEDQPSPLVRSEPPVRIRSPVVADRRHWVPDRPAPVRDFFGRTARVLHQPKKVKRGEPAANRSQFRRFVRNAGPFLERPVFAGRPKSLPICVRRSIRKSVLFALRRTGKGSKKRVRRYNENSFVECR